MNGKQVGGLVLGVVGLLNVAYGLYRGLALDKSMIPLVPIGAMCAAIGFLLLGRSRSG